MFSRSYMRFFEKSCQGENYLVKKTTSYQRNSNNTYGAIYASVLGATHDHFYGYSEPPSRSFVFTEKNNNKIYMDCGLRPDPK